MRRRGEEESEELLSKNGGPFFDEVVMRKSARGRGGVHLNISCRRLAISSVNHPIKIGKERNEFGINAIII